jgi:uncharacterized protein (DUF1684 family)
MRALVRLSSSLLSALVVVSMPACGGAVPRPADPPGEISAAWDRWRAERRESLAGEEGWLSLVALGWLDAPSTTVGADPGSGIVLPAGHSPPALGRIELREGTAWLVPSPGVEILHDGLAVTSELVLAPDDPGPPTTLAVGPLRMHLISRAGRLGLRVKDRQSPARLGFEGPEVFPYDVAFRVPARFEPAAEGESLPIVNVLGQEVAEPLAGRLRFTLAGHELVLLATWAGSTPAEGYSVMLRDATSDEGASYGAGRYLEVEAADARGGTYVDFNFAYTPPCGYTDFATCPLPPEDNTLPVAITAGERAPAGH